MTPNDSAPKHLPELPEGVSTLDWTLEQNRWQNPRIRALLRCMKILDGVTESNYTILHCSVKRLFEVWENVRKAVAILRENLAPLLDESSRIPQLDVARQAAAVGFAQLEVSLFEQLESVPEDIAGENVFLFRKTLCRSLEELGDYVKNTLSVLVANDPRSQFDIDYFLSKRFSRDVDEAEWLYSSVCALEEYVNELSRLRDPGFCDVADRIDQSKIIPSHAGWKLTEHLIVEILNTLVPMLRTVAVIPGTRLDELESLQEMTSTISARCWIVQELYTTARCDEEYEELIGDLGDHSEQSADSVILLKITFRLTEILRELGQVLQDLHAFVTIWRKGISQRRALLLTRDDHLGDDHG